MNTVLSRTAAFGLLLGLASASAVSATRYRIEAIPPVGGYWPAKATAINNLGQAVGEVTTGEQRLCFVYADGVTHVLPDSAGISCTDINDQGTVVGTGLDQKAYAWSHWSAARVELHGMAAANGINNRGQVAGSRRVDGPITAPAVYFDGQVTGLGTLGGLSGEATSIDEEGRVVGFSELESGFEHAFSWSPGHRMKDLGTLGGRRSRAKAIGSSGHIVGDADLANGGSGSFIVKGRGGMQALPGVDNPNKTLYAQGVNGRGEVAGFMTGEQDRLLATLTRKGKTRKLLDLADAASARHWLNLHTAWDINDAGQIVGGGAYRGDFSRGAYVATPIETDEP